MKRKILIAEDNAELSDMARNYLKLADYTVYQAFDGKEAVEMVKALRPDLILLDIMMPEIDGCEVCRLVRAENNIPIIVMSARTSEADKFELFDAGADDYLTKPFSFKEMVVRVAAQLRRYYEFSAPKQDVRYEDGLEIRTEEMTALANGKVLPLTAKEFKLLDALTLNAGRVIAKQRLIDLVWGVEEYIDENTVAVTVARLREKLKKEDADFIKTVWGIGYKWQKD